MWRLCSQLIDEPQISKIPNSESALQTSRKYATHPHLAGSNADFEDAKTILSLFQNEFHIHKPHQEPIFLAGSKESRHATLRLTSRHASRTPTAWIDVYYPVLNTPLNHSLSIVNDEGVVEWEADLEEDGDPRDPEAKSIGMLFLLGTGLAKKAMLRASSFMPITEIKRYLRFCEDRFEIVDVSNRTMHNLLLQGLTSRVKLSSHVMDISSAV